MVCVIGIPLPKAVLTAQPEAILKELFLGGEFAIRHEVRKEGALSRLGSAYNGKTRHAQTGSGEKKSNMLPPAATLRAYFWGTPRQW